jgi:hypothetical protein
VVRTQIPHRLSPLLTPAQQDLSDQDLAGFSADNFESVRVATSAYGIHIFGKVNIPAKPDAYIHVRIFTTGPDSIKLHSIHTEEKDDGNGGKTFRAIFNKNDELEWFDT